METRPEEFTKRSSNAFSFGVFTLLKNLFQPILANPLLIKKINFGFCLEYKSYFEVKDFEFLVEGPPAGTGHSQINNITKIFFLYLESISITIDQLMNSLI